MCSFIGSIGFSFLCLAFAIIVVVLYLFSASRNAPFPTIEVNSASINSLTLVNNTKLTSNWSIRLFVTNEDLNHIIYFDNISVNIFYMDSHLILNKTTLPSFKTDVMSIIDINPSVNGFVVPGVAANTTDHHYGMVQFGLDVSASIKFKTEIFSAGWKHLNVVCYPLMFAYANNTGTWGLLNPFICVKV
ncbi:hypothetical protein TSUD_74820 [Trifolium subterraneum]|nr:hypothetical protein TSUD_74820 [Trifolium subterraneum]